MAQNPYTLAFGTEPTELIPRTVANSEVIDAFSAKQPSQPLYMVTGVRGSGKTVFMTSIASHFRSQDEWIVVELNPERNLLEDLTSKLSSQNQLAAIFSAAKIDLSLLGFGLSLEGAAPISNVETALQRMLESLDKKGKRVLVTIDEVTNSPQIREFAASFQIFLRQKLPIYLVMTGLYENVYDLQNEKTLTFLYRAPRIDLQPLNVGTIAANYRATFGLDAGESLEMAKTTKGFAFAFQLLGYLTWNKGGRWQDTLPDYKQYLDELVYEKIWMDLSRGDRRILHAIATTSTKKVADIRAFLGIESNEFSPYRRRLIRKGVITAEGRGYVAFTLPLFGNFVLENFGEG